MRKLEETNFQLHFFLEKKKAIVFAAIHPPLTPLFYFLLFLVFLPALAQLVRFDSFQLSSDTPPHRSTHT